MPMPSVLLDTNIISGSLLNRRRLQANQIAEKTWFQKGFVTGHDFSHAEETSERCRALAPAGFAFGYCAFAVAKAGSFLRGFTARLKS
jgi:hypothetical protein